MFHFVWNLEIFEERFGTLQHLQLESMIGLLGYWGWTTIQFYKWVIQSDFTKLVIWSALNHQFHHLFHHEIFGGDETLPCFLIGIESLKVPLVAWLKLWFSPPRTVPRWGKAGGAVLCHCQVYKHDVDVSLSEKKHVFRIWKGCSIEWNWFIFGKCFNLRLWTCMETSDQKAIWCIFHHLTGGWVQDKKHSFLMIL